MKNLFRFIRNFLTINRLDLKAKRVIAPANVLNDINFILSSSPELAESIKKDIVLLIIGNNFVANPVQIIIYLKHHYNFNINEFIVLMYKVGLLTKIYLDDPIQLLSDAIALKEYFPEKEVERLKIMLEEQKRFDRKSFEHQVKMFNEYSNNKVKLKTMSEDDIANDLIDKWLNKNKK